MDRTTSVTVDIVTVEDELPYWGGGIKVTIDGTRLIKHVDGRGPTNFEWQPEYMGENVVSDMWALLETTASVRDEELIYEPQTVRFMEYPLAIVLESLGEDTVRVAYRGNKPSEQSGKPVAASPSSACGYPVQMDAWMKAVLDAGQSLRDELVELGHETPGDDDGFDPLLEDLRTQLDDT